MTKSCPVVRFSLLCLPVLFVAGCPITPVTPPVTDHATKENVALRVVAEGLASPVGLVPVPDGSGRLFVLDQIGLVRIIDANGVLAEAPFLDLRDRLGD